MKSELGGLGPGEERGFVVHGTMADPAVLDVTIDHNDPLVIDNGADPVCYPSHATALYEAVDVSTDWLTRHDLAPAAPR